MSCVIEYNIIAKEVAADVGVGVVDLYAYVEARSFFRVSTRILGETMRSAVRNKEWLKRRRAPTQDPSTNNLLSRQRLRPARPPSPRLDPCGAHS